MEPRPNVLWITLDSIRADHTTMGGYDRNTTPNLQRIVNDSDGEYFSNCFSSGISTPLSAASILTGVYPSRHGLKITNESIPGSLPTVARRFQDAGYTTASLSRNSYVSSGTGLDRGFDRFEWLAAPTFLDVLDARTIIKYFLNIRRHSAGFSRDTAKHATPYLLNELAKQWFQDFETEQPFFAYLHYNEPHRPYYPPLPYLDRYTDELDVSTKEAAKIAMRVHYDMEEIVADGCELTETEVDALKAMYDAEIAYTDEMIGRLFDYIQSLDLENTVVVITADHGELFGERGMLAHRLVINDAVSHVPLVVHGLNDVSYPTDELIQHLDVMRTIGEIADISTDGLQGIDMREATRECAITQRPPANFQPFLDHNSEFDRSRFHSEMLTSVRTDQFRFEKSEGSTKLFELPDETTDVSSNYAEKATEFDEDLSEWLQSEGMPISTGEAANLTDQMRQQLRDLGYVE
jgi:arylsulfatase A-like enzyme